MRLVVIAGLGLTGRKSKADLISGDIIFLVRIDCVPVIRGRKPPDRSLKHIRAIEAEPGRPERRPAHRRVEHGKRITLCPDGAVAIVQRLGMGLVKPDGKDLGVFVRQRRSIKLFRTGSNKSTSCHQGKQEGGKQE